MSDFKIIDQACKQAIIEDAIYKNEVRERKRKRKEHREERLKGGGLSANSLVNPYSSAYVINLNDEPVIWRETESLDENVRTTYGKYAITYLPERNDARMGKRTFPFRISQDLLHANLSVVSSGHFNKLADKIPELNWLRRNSFYNDELFHVASVNPGIPIRFDVDVIRYSGMIEKKLRERFGLYLSEATTLGSFKCALDKASKLSYNKFIVPAPGKDKYFKEFEEVDNEYLGS